MYFLPIGLRSRSGARTRSTRPAESPERLSGPDPLERIVDNLIPVTIGNVIGGSMMVGLAYWLIYVRAPD